MKTKEKRQNNAVERINSTLQVCKEGTIIDIQVKPTAGEEANAVWIFAVSRGIKPRSKIFYNFEHGNWEIQINSNSLAKALAMERECRRILGWEH